MFFHSQLGPTGGSCTGDKQIADLTKNHLRGGINGVVTFLPATDGFPSGLHPFQAWCAEGGTLTSGEIQPRRCENRQETCSFTMFYLSTTWICLRTLKKNQKHSLKIPQVVDFPLGKSTNLGRYRIVARVLQTFPMTPLWSTPEGPVQEKT